MNYVMRLEGLDPARSFLEPARERVLLWTGQSAWAAAGLDAEQAEFLREVGGKAAVLSGFPFHRDCDQYEERDLLTASLRNTIQSIWCMRNRRYRMVLASILDKAIGNTAEKLLLIAGSCGLEMLNAATEELGRELPKRVRVVALGPSCLRPLRIPNLVVIRGKRDFWSAGLYAGKIHAKTAGGHLDYWKCQGTRALVRGVWEAWDGEP